MTTPPTTNGMTYPTTAIIVASANADIAKDELANYGIDAVASASYLTIVSSAAEVAALTVDARQWAVVEPLSPIIRNMMTNRFGEAVEMHVLLSILNANKAWRGNPWTKQPL